MTEKKLNEATKAELLTYATNTLGLEVDESMTRQQLMAKVKDATSSNEIPIESKTEPTVQSELSPDEVVHVEAPKTPDAHMVEIMLIKRENDPADPLPLCCNGVNILVTRGEKVRIPRRYLEILKNAVEIRVRQEPDGEGGMKNVSYEVPAHPYQVFG